MSRWARLDIATFYDEVDENGADKKLGPSRTRQTLEYRPTKLNEYLVQQQQSWSRRYKAFQSDIVRVLSLYYEVKESTSSIPAI